MCLQQEAAVIKMPTEKTQLVKFKKWAAIDLTPYVMYFDMESLIVPVKRVVSEKPHNFKHYSDRKPSTVHFL